MSPKDKRRFAHWRCYENGLITVVELIGSFLDDLDVTDVRGELRSLPIGFFQVLKDYFTTEFLAVPSIRMFGASQEDTEAVFTTRRERAWLVQQVLRALADE
jgi:hypothetical protein